jgi:hypothetical protein
LPASRFSARACWWLAAEVAEVAEQAEGLLAAGGCGRVVVGLSLHRGELEENVGLLEAVA